VDECKPLVLGRLPAPAAWVDALPHNAKDIVGRGLHSSTFQLNLSHI